MHTSLPDTLRDLRDQLAAARLLLPLAGSAEDDETRLEALEQIDDYLLPRLERLDAPLLAVLGGSTGAGKSTITNSLVGAHVTEPGLLRPTTRAPVLVCNPADERWFQADGSGTDPRLLPDLPRATGDAATGRALHLRPHPEQPPGLALLDSPDIDSIEQSHHVLAAQLLGAADLWLFVTTAARYADAAVWRYLARAEERGAAVALIVNRIPDQEGAAAALEADIRRLAAEQHLDAVQVFTVAERPLTEGRIGAELDPLRRWLGDLVGDAEARRAVVRRTLDGALRSLTPRVSRVVDGMQRQAAAADALAHVSVERYARAHDRVATELSSGALLRGAVLDRFAEQVGTGVLMDRLQRGVSRLRERISATVSGERPAAEAARGQLKDNLATLVYDAVADAAETTVDAWRSLPGGQVLLVRDDDVSPLRRPAPGADAAITAAVADWQAFVVDLVRERGGSRMALARGLTLGVNGAGVALMMSLFASTGGLTGGEVAVAGGTAAVSQAVLGAVFGEQAVRDLARDARTELLRVVEALLSDDRDRFEERLAALPDDEQIAALERAAAHLTEAVDG